MADELRGRLPMALILEALGLPPRGSCYYVSFVAMRSGATWSCISAILCDCGGIAEAAPKSSDWTVLATRSVSRKGISGASAACEGFFGRIKTGEVPRYRVEQGRYPESAIDACIDFYNNWRIVSKFDRMAVSERLDVEVMVSKEAS